MCRTGPHCFRRSTDKEPLVLLFRRLLGVLLLAALIINVYAQKLRDSAQG